MPHSVAKNIYLMLLFLLFQDGLSSCLGLPPLATNKQHCLMARSVRLMTLIRLCGSELIEYCCKKITIKQCQQYFYLDAAQCKKTVSQNLFLILLFVFFKGRTTLLSSQPHLTINKQTILLRCCKSKESKMNPMQT